MPRKSKKQSLSEYPFSLSLMLPGRKKLTGILADVNMEGAAIAFPAGECPDLTKDERVRLILTINDAQITISLDALVLESRKSQDVILHTFKFIDTTHLLRDMDSMLISYFNRRGAFRVGSDPLTAIEVTLAWDNKITKGTVLDISVTGLSLAIESSAARQLENTKRVTITFQSFEFEESFKIIGHVANFAPIQKGVRCGIRFNRKDTKDIMKKERHLSKYIMQRQLAMLKKRAGIEDISDKKKQKRKP